MDCMSCTGPRRVPDQSNVIGCPASCLEKGLKPVLLLAHGQCFWYTLLLWNQPEIFLEHFDTILSSRCLVYIYVYTTMECSSYCGSNHQLILQDLTRENYLSYLIVKKYEYIMLMSQVLLLFKTFGFALICFALCVSFYSWDLIFLTPLLHWGHSRLITWEIIAPVCVRQLNQ